MKVETKNTMDRADINLTNVGLFRKYEEVNPDLDYIERTKTNMEIKTNENEGETKNENN